MLAGLLKSDIAVSMSVKIVDAFVAMRKYISSNLLEQKYINNLVFKHDEEIKSLQNMFSKFETSSNELFFEGEIWDSHSLLLDVVCKINKDIVIYTKNIDKTMINKYQSQYNNLTIKINNSFHDRFIIIDDAILYHCGASFKDLGKKCFAINKIDNVEILSNLKNKLCN